MITQDSIVEISDLLFVEQVVQSKLPVLLAFGADHCPASQKLLALLEEAAPLCRGFITIAKTSPDTSPGLVARFGILSVPAVLLFHGGTVSYQFIGELSRHELDELLARVCISNLATAEPTINHSATQLPTQL